MSPAYKPDFVCHAGSPLAWEVIIYLGLPSLAASRGLPADLDEQPSNARAGTPKQRCAIMPCSRKGLPSHHSHLQCWCALTAPFHPYLTNEAVYSLLHFPSAFTAQALPGTLPYEARTFLPCFSHEDLHSSDHPAHFRGAY